MLTPENYWTIGHNILFPLETIFAIFVVVSVFLEYRKQKSKL